ncbi:uncharacterized protein (UPF0335 family) [Neorhizobium sp. S3-V5DH]|nr:uncharacterized protein (UPF0335 family) [Neorhizobium sp. S3-V5DH]
MSDAHGVARDQLRAFVERIERLEEEKKTIADDIKDVYGEAKSMGFDTKILKKVIALRKKDEQERTEEEMILDTYLQALGMIPQFEMFDREEVRPASREQRRRQIMSEDMADHKALLDEMADAGLISEEARQENKVLADAVATKFGNGPVGDVNPRLIKQVVDGMQTEAGRAALTAAVDIMIAREEAEEQNAPERPSNNDKPCSKVVPQDNPSPAGTGSELLAGREGRHEGEAVSTGLPTKSEMDRATEGSFETGSEAAEKGREAIPAGPEGVDLNHAGAGEIPATNSTASDQPLAGGDHVTAHPDNAATADGLVRHTPSATFILRPNCLRPERCAGHGTNHCHACKVAARESEAA